MESTQFKVDAALLRELGERLIGRAHIALAELVKNAYDADAHTCRIDIEGDKIVVTDDGHGISEDEFHAYWMRIGTTHKVETRQSRRLKRAMTGSKGLGRLSSQFLADEVEIESTSTSTPDHKLYAFVDWRTIRSGADIQTVDVDWESIPGAALYASGERTGTRITLKGLRTDWNSETIAQLGRDVWMLRSPFKANRTVRGRTALDFYIDLNAPDIDDATAQLDRMHKALFSNWKARITGTLDGARRRHGRSPEATVSVEFTTGYPEGSDEPKVFRQSMAFPIERRDSAVTKSDADEEGDLSRKPALDRAQFEVLVFKTEGRQPDGLKVGEMRDYLRQYGNVSVYDAGFRLPYYGSQELMGQDWLDIAVDHGRRLTASELLPDSVRTAARYLLDLPNPGRIFGAVDVDTNHELAAAGRDPAPDSWLQIQPGRDRLAPNPSFEQLKDLVRLSLDFYANRYRVLADQAIQQKRSKEPPIRTFEKAVATLDQNRAEMPKAVYSDVRRDVMSVRKAIEVEHKALDSRAVILAPLATAGMAALALNHEMARDESTVMAAIATLRELESSGQVPELTRPLRQLESFVGRFNAYRRLFAPLANAEDRDATRRLSVYSIVTQVKGDVQLRMPGVRFDLTGLPREVRFPVGAFVEWSAVLQNVLFNAWNAMLDGDRRVIRFDGGTKRRRQFLQVSDSGSGLGVSLEQAAQLFEPFERRMNVSEHNRSLAIGGQGLGLAIVRMIAGLRGAAVGFVAPQTGYSTTLELSWRE